MYAFPKTERGLRSRISAYKASMQKEKRTHGSISDGYGKRYLIFWLYFVLGDLKGASHYIRWYEKNFDGDIGEPIHKLCCALLLHRLSQERKAKLMLAEAMLANLYMIPRILGEKVPRHKIRFGSNFTDSDYVEELPYEIISSITTEDWKWIGELYNSLDFRRFRKQYIDINRELNRTGDLKQRGALLRKERALLKELK